MPKFSNSASKAHRRVVEDLRPLSLHIAHANCLDRTTVAWEVSKKLVIRMHYLREYSVSIFSSSLTDGAKRGRCRSIFKQDMSTSVHPKTSTFTWVGIIVLWVSCLVHYTSFLSWKYKQWKTICWMTQCVHKTLKMHLSTQIAIIIDRSQKAKKQRSWTRFGSTSTCSRIDQVRRSTLLAIHVL